MDQLLQLVLLCVAFIAILGIVAVGAGVTIHLRHLAVARPPGLFVTFGSDCCDTVVAGDARLTYTERYFSDMALMADCWRDFAQKFFFDRAAFCLGFY